MIQHRRNCHHQEDVLKLSDEQGDGLTTDGEERGPQLRTRSGGHVIHRPRPYRQVRFSENPWPVREDIEGRRLESLTWPQHANTYYRQSLLSQAPPGVGEIHGFSPYSWYSYPSYGYRQHHFGFYGEDLTHDSDRFIASESNCSFSPYSRNHAIAGPTYNIFPPVLQHGSSACSSLTLYDSNRVLYAPALSNKSATSVSTASIPPLANYGENRDADCHGDHFVYDTLSNEKTQSFNKETITRTYPNFKKDILAKMSGISKASMNPTRTQSILRSNASQVYKRRMEVPTDSRSPPTGSVSLGVSTINESVSLTDEKNQHSFGFRSCNLQFGNKSAFSLVGESGFNSPGIRRTDLKRNTTIMYQADLNDETSGFALDPQQIESKSLASKLENSGNENYTNSKETSNFSIDSTPENAVLYAESKNYSSSFENKSKNTPPSFCSKTPEAHASVKIELNDDVHKVCSFDIRREPSKELTLVSKGSEGSSDQKEKSLEDNFESSSDMDKIERTTKNFSNILPNNCLHDSKIKFKQEEPVTEDVQNTDLVGTQTGMKRKALSDDAPETTRHSYNDQRPYTTDALGSNWSKFHHEKQTENDTVTPLATGTKNNCLLGFVTDSGCLSSYVASDHISRNMHLALGGKGNCKGQYENLTTTDISHFKAQQWNYYNRAVSKPISLDSKWVGQSKINTLPCSSLVTSEQSILQNWSCPKSIAFNLRMENNVVLNNILRNQVEQGPCEKETEQNSLSSGCSVITEVNTQVATSPASPPNKASWLQENKSENGIGDACTVSSGGCHEQGKTQETLFSKYSDKCEQMDTVTESSAHKSMHRALRRSAGNRLNAKYDYVECKDTRKTKQMLVTQSSTTESAKPNNTLKCGDCNEPFLSFSALLQHKGQGCGRQSGTSIHAPDCVGKGCSLQGAYENYRKLCECAHCLDCGRVFKSKYKVFTHSLRGCGMSSSIGRAHMSETPAFRNGVSAQRRTSELLLAKDTRWYQDGESTVVSTTQPDSSLRAYKVLESGPFCRNLTSEARDYRNTFSSVNVKHFVDDTKLKICKQGDANTLCPSPHHNTDEKAKTVPEAGILTPSSNNISKAIYHCNAPIDTKCYIGQSKEAVVNHQSCSPSHSTLDSAKKKKAIHDNFLKSNSSRVPEGQFKIVQQKENVKDTLLGNHKTSPADCEVETDTRGSVTTFTHLDEVINGLTRAFHEASGGENENITSTSLQRETARRFPITNFSRPNQETEWPEINKSKSKDCLNDVGALNEKTALMDSRKKIQIEETKALKCHDPSETGFSEYITAPDALIGLMVPKQTTSSNSSDKWKQYTEQADRPNPDNATPKPISPGSSPNRCHMPTPQKFAKSLKRKLQDIESQIIFTDMLSNCTSCGKSSENSVTRIAEHLSVTESNQNNRHFLFDNGNVTKEGTLLLKSRKTNEVSLDADSDAENHITRIRCEETVGQLNASSAQASTEGRPVAPSSETDTPTPNFKSLLHDQKPFRSALKKHLVETLNKKETKKTKIAPAQKKRQMFPFPVGNHLQESFWNTKDFTMSQMLPLKTAKTYGRRDELLENGEKQTIMYVLDAHNKPVMLVKKENPVNLYSNDAATSTTTAIQVGISEAEHTVLRSKLKKSHKTDMHVATTLVI